MKTLALIMVVLYLFVGSMELSQDHNTAGTLWLMGAAVWAFTAMISDRSGSL